MVSRSGFALAALVVACACAALVAADEFDEMVAVEVDASAELDAQFPVSNKFDRYAANCMDVSRALCLGNATEKSSKGLFAIGRDALPAGLVGHWTFDDALAQDHAGHMDALYPSPEFGPGFNGGSSAYFNGTALHWLSPSRTRSHPARMSDAEREFEAAKLKPKAKPTNAQGKAKAKRTSPPKKGESTAMNRDARAAIAHSRKPKPTPNAAAVTAAGAGAGATGALAPSAGAEDLTISFWVYLLADVVGKFRTLIYRGDKDGATPHISLWPEIRRIHLRASTGVDPVTRAKTHITLDSHSAVLIGRWTHIAFVVQGTRLAQLYVNGLLDTQKLSLQPIRIHHPSDIMYLANNPFVPNSGIRCYMDSVSIYSRALSRGEVTAIGSVVFPGLDASAVKLGCASCTLAAAAHSCRASKGSHICSRAELSSGALLIARSMGWLSNMVSVHVYSAEDITPKGTSAAKEEEQPLLGAGLCCRSS